MFDNPLRLIRELKGATLPIVLVLQIVRTRVTQRYLQQMLDLSDKTVADGLAYLAEVGIADHTSAGWQLVRGAVQLPLPAPMAEIEAESVDHKGHEGHEGVGGDVQLAVISDQSTVNSEQLSVSGDEGNSDKDCQGRNNSDSLLVSLVNIDSINNEDLTKLTNNGETRKISDSDLVWEELGAVGVKKNRATEQIAALDWVDSDFVRGMIEKLEGEGRTWPKDCGLLLYRLKQRPKELRHGKDCACEACDEKRRARYADRRFS